MIYIEYPWADLSPQTTVCDVGGGVGGVSMQLARCHPNLNFVVQDLPENVERARNEVWPKLFPEALQQGRVQFEPIDFLVQAPKKGCDIYLVSTLRLAGFFSRKSCTQQECWR